MCCLCCQADNSYTEHSTAKHPPNYPLLHRAAVIFGCKQCNQGGSNVEHIRGSSVTGSQVSLYLRVMDINEESGRQNMGCGLANSISENAEGICFESALRWEDPNASDGIMCSWTSVCLLILRSHAKISQENMPGCCCRSLVQWC